MASTGTSVASTGLIFMLTASMTGVLFGGVALAPAATAVGGSVVPGAEVASADAASCYPLGLPAQTNLGDPKVTLGSTGAFDLAQCGSNYRQVLSVNAASQGRLPNVGRSRAAFVGIDGAYFAFNDPVYGWNLGSAPRKLARTLTDSCAVDGAWDAINARAIAQDARYNPDKPSKYVVNQCAGGTYMNELLYGPTGLFTGDQRRDFVGTVPSQKTVDGKSRTVLTWTRGYLLQKYGQQCSDCGKPGSKSYRVVVDAGSSGTRLSLYRVVYRPSGYPTITWKRTIERDDAENGIDDYANPDPSQRPGTGNVNTDVMDPLLDLLTEGFFTKHEPQSDSNIKVDVLATAGMRDAKQKWGKPAVDDLYAQLRKGIADRSKSFNRQLGELSTGSHYSPGLTRTINGNTQEGVWTWIDLNDYYCNYFGNPNGQTRSKCRGTRGGFLGVVGVGGASTQVAFPVKAKAKSGHKFVHQVAINGRNLRVYNKTFLGLGQDSARRSMVQS